MTQGVRKLSNKLASFINTRNPIVNVDRHLANSKNNSLLQEFPCVQSSLHIPIENHDISMRSWFHHTAFNVNENQSSITTSIDVLANSSPRAATKSDCSFLLSYGLSCNTNILNWNVRANRINTRSVIKYSTLSAQGSSTQPEQDNKGLPSGDQLQKVSDKLAEQLPRLYVQTIDYSLFSQHLIVIDNVKGTVTKGLIPFIQRMSYMRIVGHIRYAYVRFCIVKMTTHPEEGSIKLHWRIKGLTTLSVICNVWKFKPWDIASSLQAAEALFKWKDGLYTFYVNEEGKIYKCIVDNVIQDSPQDTKGKLKDKVTAKISAEVPRPTPGASASELK